MLLIEMFLLFFFIYYSWFICIIYFIIPGDIDLLNLKIFILEVEQMFLFFRNSMRFSLN